MAINPMREISPSADLAVRVATISPREKQVAQLMALDLDNAQIAYVLGVSESTVKAHAVALLARLNVRSRIGVAMAIHGVDVSYPVARVKLVEWRAEHQGHIAEGA